MISVIMATYNGASTLPITLEAFLQLETPTGGVEFIAVDNGSTDGSAEVLREFEARLPLTILSEPRRGKSFALNTGIDAARGELLVFADDDVVPERHWLNAYAAAASRHPDVTVFAGQIRHLWQKSPPRWLEQLAAEGQAYGGTPIERRAGYIHPGLVKGANFMVRRPIADRFRFADGGPVNFSAGAGIGGEDSRFVMDAAEAGERILFVPEASLKHIVRPHQVGLAPVLRRAFRLGRAWVVTGGAPKGSGRTILGYPGWALRRVLRYSAGAISHLVRLNYPRVFHEMVRITHIFGVLYQSKSQGGKVSL
jgi:glucosyl-dolichyl phosphate glucuronosyltransferase